MFQTVRNKKSLHLLPIEDQDFILKIAPRLEGTFKGPVELELTKQRSTLYFLQARRAFLNPKATKRAYANILLNGALTRKEALERIKEAAKADVSKVDLAEQPISEGIGVSAGIIIGPIALSIKKAMQFAQEGKSANLIMEYTPVREMKDIYPKRIGVTTIHGGTSQHYAVWCRKLGRPYVTMVSDLGIDLKKGEVILGGKTFREGDVITIDGSTGKIYEGIAKVIPSSSPLSSAGEIEPLTRAGVIPARNPAAQSFITRAYPAKVRKTGSEEEFEDLVTLFWLDRSRKVHFSDYREVIKRIGDLQYRRLKSALQKTISMIYGNPDYRYIYDSLLERRIRLRLTQDIDTVSYVTPHELVFHIDALRAEEEKADEREKLLIGILEHEFTHLENPELHEAQVSQQSIYFYADHRDILQATIDQLSGADSFLVSPAWLEILLSIDQIIALDDFWREFANTGAPAELLNIRTQRAKTSRQQAKDVIKQRLKSSSDKSRGLKEEKLIERFRYLFFEHGTAIIGYKLGKFAYKLIRISPAAEGDAYSAESASEVIFNRDTRVDILRDSGSVAEEWIEELRLYQKDPELYQLRSMLLLNDLHEVRRAVGILRDRIQDNKNAEEAARLLYAAAFYNYHPDPGISSQIRVMVNKLVEDIFTERPLEFPESRVNYSIIKGEPIDIVIRIPVSFNPLRSKKTREKYQAMVLLAKNGLLRRKRISMSLDIKSCDEDHIVFRAEVKAKWGWINYAVQLSKDAGKTWEYEMSDPHSNGLLKVTPDERGKRILSTYADTFNLVINEDHRPLRDETGAYVYGTFDDIAQQLRAIKAEGYSRIYLLGALELGWAGDAGPDPSVFSIWDGITVRRDLGGLEALLRLKERAEQLGMRIALDSISHFARANQSYHPRFPVYTSDGEGGLARRAGWDGISSEWFDSFMVNMRDLRNVDRLVAIYKQLAGLGFYLRVDVGHAFDAVFPFDSNQSKRSLLFGEVVTAGFDGLDLRGTWEANIALQRIAYQIQKAYPGRVLYCEQWHGNEARMIKAGLIPYNPLQKNLENVMRGTGVHEDGGLYQTLAYLDNIVSLSGGQTLGLFNSQDEEAPLSNYQNAIWPVAAFLALSTYGPLVYHISRLPNLEEEATMRKRFELAYLECWKHWVMNRFDHPWGGEEEARRGIIDRYPLLENYAGYLRGLYDLADSDRVFTHGRIMPINTNNNRVAGFVREHRDASVICLFNFPDVDNNKEPIPMTRLVSFTTQGLDIDPEAFYEIREIYNNEIGRSRRHKKKLYSGEALMHLGFWAYLGPAGTRVFTLKKVAGKVNVYNALLESLRRYHRYGRADRVRYAYIAKVLVGLLEDNSRKAKKEFIEVFVTLVKILSDKKVNLEIGKLSNLFRDISQDSQLLRQRIIERLAIIAVDKKLVPDAYVSQRAVDIIRSIEFGTIVLVSPEVRYGGGKGGVALYVTDMAESLADLGFDVVVVTPLYEANRGFIFHHYHPRFLGDSVYVSLPDPYQQGEPLSYGDPERINIFSAKVGKVDVLYLENNPYFDRPYGGSIGEDKLRRIYMLSLGSFLALRSQNIYPVIIQTNDWPTFEAPLLLKVYSELLSDEHFRETKVVSVLHNPHPHYSVTLSEDDQNKKDYYMRVLGLDPWRHHGSIINPEDGELSLMYSAAETSDCLVTVSRPMRDRVLREPHVFGYSRSFGDQFNRGRFYGIQNRFRMVERQKAWFIARRAMVEVYSRTAKNRIFRRWTKIRNTAQAALQEAFSLEKNVNTQDHVAYAMLHRISPQKGFQLLVWKVENPETGQEETVLESFLRSDPRIQFIIAGAPEDSPDGQYFDREFSRIAENPEFSGRFVYRNKFVNPVEEWALYRNIYVGADWFVMPSGGEVGEPGGLSQLESLAGGTPVIAHNQDGLQSTIYDHTFGDTQPMNGIKFAGFDGPTLLEALKEGLRVYYGYEHKHTDRRGRPIKYRTISFNAFNSDNRWIRSLREIP